MIQIIPKWIVSNLLRRPFFLFLIVVGLVFERIVELPFRIAMAIDQVGHKGTVKDE